MVNSFDAILAKSALVIGRQFEDFLEPIREESFVLCCKNNPFIVIIHDAFSGAPLDYNRLRSHNHNIDI